MTTSLNFTLNRDHPEALVEQIVRDISRALQQGALHGGTRMPSIRQLARELGVSTFTVVEAYDRLVAQGLLAARRGAGFFVADGVAPGRLPPPARIGPYSAREVGAAWLLTEIFADESIPVKSGCGWLPDTWLDDDGLHGALRQLARPARATNSANPMSPMNPRFVHYGHPQGYAPLRQLIARRLGDIALDAPPEQIVLTHGATQALDLIARTLLRPGDTVLVEEPTYCNLLAILDRAGMHVHSVPRNATGLDLAALETAAQAHRPRALFLNTVLQNPLGTTLSPACAHRVLQCAEQYGFWVIEDDIYRELAPLGSPALAAMDGLERVIYVGSFSKTISPSVRVGYVAAPLDLATEITRTKMIGGLTTSEINERLVHAILTEGRHRKHIERITDRLTRHRGRLISQLAAHGLAPLATPDGGMFVCARLPEDVPPDTPSARELADRALTQGIMLAPGDFFLAQPQPCHWFRFNVAYSDDARLYRFFDGILTGKRQSAGAPA